MPEATQVQEDKEVGTREPPETLGQRRERWGEVGAMQQVLGGLLKERMRGAPSGQRAGVCHRVGQCGKGGRQGEEAVVAGAEVVISQVQCEGEVQVGPDWVGTGDTLPPCLDMADPSQNPSLTPPGCMGLLWGHTVPRFLPSCPVSLVTRLPPPLA